MAMNVNNTNKYVFLIIVLLFLSCKEKQKISNNIEEENTYQIISLLLSEFRESMVLRPGFSPPPGEDTYEFTTKDSLRSYKYFYKQTIKKKDNSFLASNICFREKT